MNLILGDLGVILGLSGSIAGVVALAIGLRRRDERLLGSARIYAGIVLAGSVLAIVAMERALITRDFTVAYVADNGSSTTPALFNVATLWASLEGSILLWALVLAGYIVAVAWKFRDRITDPMVAWALLVMFAVALFFFGLMAGPIGPADPFVAFDPPLGYDGPGPNPLLQEHILMAVHPPMLYLGYVGFTVPFAFAVAALVTGRLGEGWLIETRRWTLIAWGFLTAGIVLGAWWAYEVLGWGGYWGWDPVENASFLPWLTATAYLHSVMVQERNGLLRVWNLALICATFSLTILGTFLTRSGVIESVHAFTESGIGPALLSLFAVIVLVTVGLIGWRGDMLRSKGGIDSPVSREGSLLLNNLLFAGFAFMVLTGTVFPLVVEALQDERISVGRPYFDRMSTGVGLALLFLMAVAPMLPWRKANPETVASRLIGPAWFAAGVTVVAVLIGERGLAPLLAYALGAFAGGSAARHVWLATRRNGWRGLLGRSNGGMIVHIGVVIVAIAIAASGSNVQQAEFTLEEGESATFAGHTFAFEGIRTEELANRLVVRADVRIDDGPIYSPAVNQYFNTGRQIQTPSVYSTATEDLSLSLLVVPEQAGDPVVLRVTAQPLIVWLWIGGTVMVLGALLAAWPRRRERPVPDPDRKSSQSASDADAEGRDFGSGDAPAVAADA